MLLGASSLGKIGQIEFHGQLIKNIIKKIYVLLKLSNSSLYYKYQTLIMLR